MLILLTQASLQNKFRFKKHNIRPEGDAMDEDADDVDDGGMDGGADLADVIHAAESDDDLIEDELEIGGNNAHADLARQMEAEMAQNAII